MRKIAFLALSLVSTMAFGQGFSGDFDPALWVINDPLGVGGSVNTSGAPGSIIITGGDNSVGGDYDYELTYNGPCAASVTFDYEVVHPDCGWDNIYYGVNGVFVFLTDCNATGTVNGVVLNPGDVFTLRINTEDGIAGAPDFIVSNLVNEGGFNPGDWTIVQNNSNGTVDETQAPCQITITGTDGLSGAGDISYEFTATACGFITFDYVVTHPDCGWDFFNYTINGVQTQLADCSTSGSAGPIAVALGDVFSLQITSVDNGAGAPVVVVSNMVVAYDNLAPVPDQAFLSDINEGCAITSLTPPTATDACDGVITGTPDVTLPLYNSTLINWTYTDNQGNVSTQQQWAYINDFFGPTPDVANLPDVIGTCSVTPTEPTATDDCGGPVSVYSNVNFPITTIGTTVVTWFYYDQNGNQTAQDQNIIVTDDIDPILVAPADVTAGIDTLTCMSAANDTTVYYILLDQMVDITGTYGPLCIGTEDVFICGATAGFYWVDTNSIAPSSVMVEYFQTYNDFGSLNTILNGDLQSSMYTGIVETACSAFDVVDQNLDVASYIVGDTNLLLVESTSGCIVWDQTLDATWMPTSYAKVTVVYAGVELGYPTASDDCQLASVTNDAPGVFPQGQTTVTWTATDAAGNSATATQIVTINGLAASVTFVDSTLSVDNAPVGATYQWIDCANGNAPISGATNSSLDITSNGEYAVIVSQGNCVDTSACLLVDDLGFQSMVLNTFNAYPNPADNVLNIVSDMNGKVEMLDINGRIILVAELNGSAVELNVASVLPGSYSIRFTTEASTEVKRVIIR